MDAKEHEEDCMPERSVIHIDIFGGLVDGERGQSSVLIMK
jgi:hypothetical protein